MKLLCSEVMHRIEKEDTLLIVGDDPLIVRPSEKRHQKYIQPLRPLVHKAQKFIFDTGSDQDVRTVTAVRETAVNMLEAGLFHLPFPLIWIEDPYSDDQEGIQRNYYLAEETDDKITVRLLQSINPKTFSTPEMMIKRMPITVHEATMVIDLKNPHDSFTIEGVGRLESDITKQVYAETIYSLKKLIVVLNTKDIVLDRVSAGKGRRETRFRSYEHTVIRIPSETTEPLDEGSNPDGTPTRRKKHLVSGFMWGKNTRPLDQQRWIFPHWRGDQSIGVVERSHRLVKQ